MNYFFQIELWDSLKVKETQKTQSEVIWKILLLFFEEKNMHVSQALMFKLKVTNNDVFKFSLFFKGKL